MFLINAKKDENDRLKLVAREIDDAATVHGKAVVVADMGALKALAGRFAIYLNGELVEGIEPDPAEELLDRVRSAAYDSRPSNAYRAMKQGLKRLGNLEKSVGLNKSEDEQAEASTSAKKKR